MTTITAPAAIEIRIYPRTTHRFVLVGRKIKAIALRIDSIFEGAAHAPTRDISEKFGMIGILR